MWYSQCVYVLRKDLRTATFALHNINRLVLQYRGGVMVNRVVPSITQLELPTF